MEFKKFKNGKDFTIGVELELRILDKSELGLRNEFDSLTTKIASKYKKNLAREFLDSIIEINTPVFSKEKELISYIKDITKQLKNMASKKGLLLQASGSYAQKNNDTELIRLIHTITEQQQLAQRKIAKRKKQQLLVQQKPEQHIKPKIAVKISTKSVKSNAKPIIKKPKAVAPSKSSATKAKPPLVPQKPAVSPVKPQKAPSKEKPKPFKI